MTAAARILVAHNVPKARRGGMSRLMGFIHDYAMAAGHAVDWLTADDVPAPARGRWGRFLFPLAVRRHAAAAARAGRPYHIINVHEPSAALIAGNRRVTGRPAVVVTSHGVEARAWALALEELALGRAGPGAVSRVTVPLTVLTQCRYGLTHADHVLCLNTQDQVFLHDRFGLPGNRITRITPGVDAGYAAGTERRDYAGSSRLLFAGTWRKNKGIEDLIPGFVTLAARHPALTLTVLGAGASEDQVRGAFPEPIRARVRSVTALDDAGSAAIYAEHDAFLLPSLFEGTPLTLLEAMASGLPVVTTATCGMLDVIRHEVNGLLIPIRSPAAIVAAVERLLADPPLRARLGRAARTDALHRHSWAQAAAPVLGVYTDLLARRA